MSIARWVLLTLCSTVLAAALLALHMPAAILLACMCSAIAFALRASQRITPLVFPRRPFDWAQGVLGCLMAQSLHPEALGAVAARWPAVLGVTLLLFAASTGLGWWLMRKQVMPGTTAIWGMTPGASFAMVAMAEEFGADARLVAFMQYTRAVVVTVTAAVVSRIFVGPGSGAAATTEWLALGDPGALAWTAALALGGPWLARRFGLPGGAIVLPLVGSVLVQLVLGTAPALPPLLLAAAYAAIGWSVGLRFTREVLAHALRALPIVLMAIALLMIVGVISGAALVVFAGLDPLSAYLATSPGGVDSIAVIAATSTVDTSFVMAMQLARFLVVLLVGPITCRWLARRSGPPRAA